MTLIRQYFTVAATAFAALFLVAALMAAVAAAQSDGHGQALLSPATAAAMTFGYTLILGTPTALLFGAPCYVLLVRMGRARWLHALGVGALPGILALALDPALGFQAAACGAAVALATHLAHRRFGLHET